VAGIEGTALNMLIEQKRTSPQALKTAAMSVGTQPPRLATVSAKKTNTDRVNGMISMASSVRNKRSANDRLAAKLAAEAEANEGPSGQKKVRAGPTIAYKLPSGRIAYRKNPHYGKISSST
jgi:hypothetical protein